MFFFLLWSDISPVKMEKKSSVPRSRQDLGPLSRNFGAIKDRIELNVKAGYKGNKLLQK